MFEIAKSSMLLFFQGRLFRNPADVVRQLAIGISVTIVMFLFLAKWAGLPIAAAAAGFMGGVLQPVLFKDLKFR
jgi:H+/Cl- antiporter ClcA